MKKLSHAVLTMLTPLVIGTSAHAAAWTQLDLTGATTLSHRLDQTGSSFEVQYVPFTVNAGETQTFRWNYTITVADDGLPFTPTGPDLSGEVDSYSMCNRISPTTCPPAPTGYESAFAQLIVGHVDARAIPPFLNLVADGLRFATPRGPESDFISQSGTLEVGVSLADTSFLSYSGSFRVISDQWVIASPVPEPETYALVLSGLLSVGAARRRKRTAATTGLAAAG
jgi:hypothetical protein